MTEGRIWDPGAPPPMTESPALAEQYAACGCERCTCDRELIANLQREREEDRQAILWLLGIANERMRLALGRPLDLNDEGAQPFGAAIQRAQERP